MRVVIKKWFMAPLPVHDFRHFNADDRISLDERGRAAPSLHWQMGHRLEQFMVERGQFGKDREQDLLGVQPMVIVVRFIQHERL